MTQLLNNEFFWPSYYAAIMFGIFGYLILWHANKRTQQSEYSVLGATIIFIVSGILINGRSPYLMDFLIGALIISANVFVPLVLFYLCIIDILYNKSLWWKKLIKYVFGMFLFSVLWLYIPAKGGANDNVVCGCAGTNSPGTIRSIN